ncbi:hypothetical protein [Streptomyces sp. NPDC005385]|uniref:hypothetical protein n=1 Tax=Streptomyces sp. NPDC005385 TaxID=3157039 RepID=UPI0033A0A374
MINVEITPATEGDELEETVTLSVAYYLSLLNAKRELGQLKASMPTPGYDPGLADSADYLSTDHPDLIDYQGMTTAQAMESYPELFDYDLYERDC